MKVKATVCTACKDTIFSRAHHDFRYCTCKKTFIDGGFLYVRVGGESRDIIDLEIEATKEDLYEDWNHRIDRFGLIKEKVKEL